MSLRLGHDHTRDQSVMCPDIIYLQPLTGKMQKPRSRAEISHLFKISQQTGSVTWWPTASLPGMKPGERTFQVWLLASRVSSEVVTGFVTLSKPLSLSGPQFPPLKNKGLVSTLEHASDPPGGLVQTQTAGSHPQSLWYGRSALRLEDLHYYVVCEGHWCCRFTDAFWGPLD